MNSKNVEKWTPAGGRTPSRCGAHNRQPLQKSGVRKERLRRDAASASRPARVHFSTLLAARQQNINDYTNWTDL